MRLLLYKDLDLRRVRPAFEKLRAAIEADDFRSANVKKLNAGPYYRAKLDYANRLLLQFARVSEGEGAVTVCLALEVIENHAYDKSRFLRGAVVDEAKIEHEPAAEATAPALGADATPLRWLGPGRTQFELLDKPIVFDEAQDGAYRHPAPLVVIGSAGSGKTAVTLARLREAEGRVLYVTLSAYLAQSARALHAAHGFDNPKQEVDFLSYRELLETLRVPPGREVTLPAFARWCDRHRQTLRLLGGASGAMDPQALFEEFRGVIGAQPGGPLCLSDYLALGTRQSLLNCAQRESAHGLFQRYVVWLGEAGLYDSNLVAYAWRMQIAEAAEPIYDFIVIDEVQDLTPVQLALVLALLKRPGQFILCGDSHQIVHPNFFSWAALKSLFWHGLAGDAAQRQPLQLLQANYRNTRAVTELANRLLKIKQARFGSVDRESNFLVRSTAPEAGRVVLVAAKDAAVQALDASTRQSAQHAVIVLRDDDKSAARARFRTPLVFSVHEAKGLEYPHVLLVDIVSGQRQAYAEVCDGVQPTDLETDELDYRRAKDKADKSLELYKFYVNALYVAMTRAVQTLTLVESDTGHPLLALLGLQADEAQVQAVRASTREEWAQEARKLQLQGKEEQAQAIRDAFLQHKPVPWTPWSRALVEELLPKALDPRNPSAKPRQTLFDYALWHGQHEWVTTLGKAHFAPARQLLDEGQFWGAGSLLPNRYGFRNDAWERLKNLTRRSVAAVRQRHLQPWEAKKLKDLLQQVDQYGPDHATPVGATPLMLAAVAGNAPLVQALLDKGADPQLRDDFGHTPWDGALSRALQEPGFAATGLPAVFPLLAPAALDVQVDGRLVRLERRQGEYWVLMLMLAGLKTQWSRCVTRALEPHKYAKGFFAEQLHEVLARLPAWLWSDKRRKRSYVNQVLARAEASSTYVPARKLWVRASNGHYLPNPALQLRAGDAWTLVYTAMALDWVDLGCGDGELYRPKPQELVARLGAVIREDSGERDASALAPSDGPV
ncbi:UvrD-helicase domain-containing protein [Roseateles sp. LKC17W]|uniref:DNA 3'-5' helicase II n=1 Tax=Pelomonas margarita TaxID=3299031 RepID=A0ABW7FPM2_9BURK